MRERIIDLSHTVAAGTPSWEGVDALHAEVVARFEKEGYYARTVWLDEHSSTHLDAPAHMAAGGWTVDRIPPDRLLGPLVLVDITEKAKANSDALLTPEDIAGWENRYGAIAAGSIVIARTGWASRWSSPEAYRNADAGGTLHFPGYSVAAAELVIARGGVGIGIDTLSVDHGPSHEYAVHRLCAAHGVYHLENVANLEGVPEAGARAIVMPMKLENGSAAPVRILALVP